MEDLKKNTAYRPDVDGLRAIAVLAVVIFHFFPKNLTGGYLGVDVFFVISGFLVTKIIYTALESKKFSFFHFYSKRVLRLFPALICMLLAVLVAGWLLLLAEEYASLGKHVFSGSFFISNFTLFFESGYFDRNTDLKPLLHLWSLGVEEQFYFIWPVLLFFSYRKSETFLKYTLVFIFSVSLFCSVYLTKTYPSFGFYLLPTRLWELAAGGLVSLFLERLLKKIPPSWRDLLALAGLIVLGIAFYRFDSKTVFPGYRALLPVACTVAMVIALGSRTNRILSSKPIVYLGLISYPLYLWHWPLLSFASIYYTRAAIPSLVLAGLILLSFLLASLTYEWVEKPLKRMSLQKKNILLLLFSLWALGGVGTVLYFARGLPSRFPEIEKIRKSQTRFSSTDDTENGKICAQKILKVEMCTVSDPMRPPTVALIGDSQANHFYPGLNQHYSKKGDNLVVLAKSGTPPLVGVVSQRSQDTSLADVFSYISQTPTIHTVILSAFWGNYHEENGVRVSNIFYKNRIADEATHYNEDQSKIMREGLERTIQFIQKLNKKLHIFYGIAPLPFDLEACLSRPHRRVPSNCQFDFDVKTDVGSSYRTKMEKIARSYPSISLWDPVPILCAEGHCLLIKDEITLYSDESHLSEQGSIWVLKNFRD